MEIKQEEQILSQRVKLYHSFIPKLAFVALVATIVLGTTKMSYGEGSLRYNILQAVFYAFTVSLLIEISKRVGRQIRDAPAETLPDEVYKISGDLSSVYFGTAVFIWEAKILISSLLDAYPLLDGIWKDALFAMISIVNSWFFLLGTAYIYPKLRVQSETVDKTNSLSQSINRFFNGSGLWRAAKWFRTILVQPGKIRVIILALSLVLTGLLAIFFSQNEHKGSFTDHPIVYIVDAATALVLCLYMSVVFFKVFYNRDYPYLANFCAIIMILIAAITLTNAMPGWAYNQINQLVAPFTEQSISAKSLIGFTSNTYKIVFIPLLLMLVITYFIELLSDLNEDYRIKNAESNDRGQELEKFNNQLAKTNRELQSAYLDLDDLNRELDEKNIELGQSNTELTHRYVNYLGTMRRRIEYHIENPRYEKNKLAQEVIYKSLNMIEGTLRQYDYHNSLIKGGSLSVQNFIKSMISLTWVDHIGAPKDLLDLKEVNVPENLRFSYPKTDYLARLFAELLFNINEHAYTRVPLIKQKLTVKASLVAPNLLKITLIDKGVNYKPEDINKPERIGRGLIDDYVRKFNGQISFQPATYDNEGKALGTMCELSLNLPPNNNATT